MNARKPKPRKTPVLANTEYVSPDPDNSDDVWVARLELIDAVKRVFPEFLETLSGKVFPFYEKLATAGDDFDQILYSPIRSPYKALTEDSPLKRALSKWGAEFNADSGWFMDEALRTLGDWYVAPDWRESLRWNPLHSSSPSGATGEPFEFQCHGWETERQTWLEYSKWLRKRFDEKLSAYEERTRKLAESYRLVRARRTHSPDNLDWFVLYQFAGLSSTKIADEWARTHGAYVDESTVLKGIKAAAKLTGWDRLRNPQGKWPRKGKRPRKIW